MLHGDCDWSAKSAASALRRQGVFRHKASGFASYACATPQASERASERREGTETDEHPAVQRQHLRILRAMSPAAALSSPGTVSLVQYL